MKEFERVQAGPLGIRRDQWHFEVEGLDANCRKLCREAVAFKVGLQQLRSEFMERRVRIELPGLRNGVGHVQPAIRRRAVAKGFGKIGNGRLPARADELHAATSSSLTAITFTPSDATGAR